MEPELQQEIERSIQSVKAGDRTGYRRIVEIMLPILRAYVAARSLPGMDVDDILQRVFIEAYKSLGRYREGTDFRGWLITIARYQTLMEATRLRRQADYHSRFIPVAIARQMEQRLSDDDTADDRLMHLRQCLEQVKDSSRELLRRRYEESLSMKQIAAALSRSAGAVRKELCVVRRQLHDCIQRKMKPGSTAGH